MSRFHIVTDEHGRYAPCFKPSGGNASITNVGVASARVALPTGCGEASLIRVSATADMWIKLGDSSVEAAAGDILFLSGTEHIVVPDAVTHIAALTVDGSTDKVLGITLVE